MSIDIEYAIKQDIRNNPVVREIDRDQKRDFRRMILLGALIVGMLLFAAVQQFKMVNNSMTVERVRQQLAAEEALQRKLRLQLESQLAPQVIADRAARELQMMAPSPDDVRVLERVSGASPSRAVIAEAR
jgi:hypothetical protein